MSEALWVTGDTIDVLRKMPDGCVDLIMTSPPFLALRSYLPPDDPAKGQEIGQEATPGEFLDVLLDITEECARVLAPHGTLVVELGDTYSGSGGAGGDYAEGGLREGQPKFKQRTDGGRYPNGYSGNSTGHDVSGSNPGFDVRPANGGPGWPLAKSLCLIPELYRFALAYGFNPLTQRRTDPWRVRNVVRWCRPNPPVGALGDKFRPATSEMVVACKSGKRWFDLDAVRTDPSEVKDQRHRTTNGPKQDADPSEVLTANYHQRVPSNPAGAPPLDWWNDVVDDDWLDVFLDQMWEIPTSPYKGSHYATYPEALCVRPIKAMCPLQVCTVCGEPRRRIVEADAEARHANRERSGFAARDGREDGAYVGGFQSPEVRTLGWTDCGHNAYRPGRVLDIFGGSGTTLAVAVGHGRDGIGIDLDARNVALARDRVGPLWFTECTVDELTEALSGETRTEADRPRDALLAQGPEGVA